MKVFIVIPNWNGADMIAECLESLQKQSAKATVIVVDNASSDNSVELIESKFPDVVLLKNKSNEGFAGGVNTGIRYALKNNAKYIALFNNDAVADKDWVKTLIDTLDKDPEAGSSTTRLLTYDKKKIDNTGDQYSIWGLTITRQRGEKAENAKKTQDEVYGSCAGACLYRAEALRDVGLFDEKFFAYYEDTDLNFRLQLKGWGALYCPNSIAYHAIGGTSSKLSGFTTYQTMKNLPMLFFKNTPIGLMHKMLPRFFMVYYSILFNSLFKGRGWPALKGHLVWLKNIPHTIYQRRKIQKTKRASNDYIWSILYKDLPPDAHNLRKLRSFFTGSR